MDLSSNALVDFINNRDITILARNLVHHLKTSQQADEPKLDAEIQEWYRNARKSVDSTSEGYQTVGIVIRNVEEAESLRRTLQKLLKLIGIFVDPNPENRKSLSILESLEEWYRRSRKYGDIYHNDPLHLIKGAVKGQEQLGTLPSSLPETFKNNKDIVWKLLRHPSLQEVVPCSRLSRLIQFLYELEGKTFSYLTQQGYNFLGSPLSFEMP